MGFMAEFSRDTRRISETMTMGECLFALCNQEDEATSVNMFFSEVLKSKKRQVRITLWEDCNVNLLACSYTFALLNGTCLNLFSRFFV